MADFRIGKNVRFMDANNVERSFVSKLDDLIDVDLTVSAPLEGDTLKFVNGVWKTSSAAVIVTPQPVTDLSAANITQTTLTLSWAVSAGATSYDVEQDGVLLINIGSTQHHVEGLTPGTAYNFTVKAKNLAGTSTGTSVPVTTQVIPIPQAVVQLRYADVTTTSLTLLWDASSGATSYDLLQNGEFIGNTISTTYAVSGLTAETSYNFTIKAKNSSGTSSGTMVPVVTLGETVNNMIFHVDFGGKSGTTSNTIVDTMNGVSCTLVGVAHDGTDGYIDNKGLKVKTGGYVTVPTATGVLKTLMQPATEGLTFEFVAYETVGVLFRNNPTIMRAHITGTIAQTNLKYVSTDTTEKSTFTQYSGWISEDGSPNTSSVDSTHGIKELNVITVRVSPNGKYETFINGKAPVQTSNITDFANYSDLFGTSDLHIRRNEIGLNVNPTVLKAFSIFNKPLSADEIKQRYNGYKSVEPLSEVSVNPANVALQSGETQVLAVSASPMRYTPLLSKSFDSGNSGFVTVDSIGLLTGVNAGDTTVAITSTYEGQTFNNSVNVTVGGTPVAPPASTRTITGIAMNREAVTIEVGEAFPAMATTLPFDVFYDNIVVWESSNPAVCNVNLGVLEGVAAGTATITAYDGTKTFQDSFVVTVTNPVVTTITEPQTYNVVLATYDISGSNTNAIATTNGIQAAMDFALAQGYKKIVFPFATYLITPDARTIHLPTDMLIDFSDSIINIELSSKTPLGYAMFEFDYVKNTKMIRAHIYGEYDSTTIPYAHEMCQSIIWKECENSGIEDCTVSKSPGFNMQTHTRLTKTGTTGASIPKASFVAGGINASGVNDDSVTTFRFRSNAFLNISGLGDYYMVGYNQGYYGYNHLRSRLYSIFFYDINQTFISAQMYNLQFYNYDKPANAKFAKLVIYQDTAPTTQDNDFNAVAFIRTVGMPRKCFIKNSVIEDNGSCGLAMCGGQGWLIEGNHFARNGKRMPACDIDWEDGWDTAVGDVVRNNSFNSNVGIIISAGGSLVYYDNTFTKSTFLAYGRAANWRVYNNFFDGKGAVTLACQAESYFSRNILSVVRATKAIQHPGASYAIRDTNNTLI